jgi:predicted Fe-Mo cluster-binding NifX family protein
VIIWKREVGKAPYFLIGTVEEGSITHWEIVGNPAGTLEKKRGVRAAEFLKEKDVDVLVMREIGGGSQYALTAKQIQAKPPEGKTLAEIIVAAAQT